MQTYSRCSEQYRLQKVEKVPEQMTAWAPQGNGVHTGYEKWELSDRTMTEDQAVDIAVAEYDRLIKGQREKAPEDRNWLTGGRTKVQVDIDRRRDRVAEHLRGLIQYSLGNADKFRPARLPDDRPAVEVPFIITVNGVTVKGAIDLVLEWEPGQLSIRDIKTGNKLPNDPLQLTLYALAWFRLFGDVIEYGDFFMTKNNAPTDPYPLTEFSEAKLGAWLEMFDRSEKDGIYLPSGGDHCRVCTVRPYCTLMGQSALSQAYVMPNMSPNVLNYNEREETT